jgi:hypothetical protein
MHDVSKPTLVASVLGVGDDIRGFSLFNTPPLRIAAHTQ